MKLVTIISISIVLVFAAVIIFLIISNPAKSEINSCINNDSEVEKVCFMKLMCKNQDFNLCNKMPTDTNSRQGNKAFCLAFAASMTNDLSICRNQKNQYYANVCEQGYQRWAMSFDASSISEFKDLQKTYGCTSD